MALPAKISKTTPGKVARLSPRRAREKKTAGGCPPRKVVIPSAGHAVNIDQPQAFVDAVIPFLKNLPAEADCERT
jgi:pimeloyl-ACP methyl ester carboxylesterase